MDDTRTQLSDKKWLISPTLFQSATKISPFGGESFLSPNKCLANERTWRQEDLIQQITLLHEQNKEQEERITNLQKLNDQLVSATSEFNDVCTLKAKYTKEKDTMMINHERELADRADKLREIKCRFDQERANWSERMLDAERDKMSLQMQLESEREAYKIQLELQKQESGNIATTLKDYESVRQQNAEMMKMSLEDKVKRLEEDIEKLKKEDQEKVDKITNEAQRNLALIKAIHENEKIVLSGKISALQGEKKTLESQNEYNFQLLNEMSQKSRQIEEEQGDQYDKLRKKISELEQTVLQKESHILKIQSKLEGNDIGARYNFKTYEEELKKMSSKKGELYSFLIQEEYSKKNSLLVQELLTNEEKLKKFRGQAISNRQTSNQNSHHMITNNNSSSTNSFLMSNQNNNNNNLAANFSSANINSSSSNNIQIPNNYNSNNYLQSQQNIVCGQIPANNQIVSSLNSPVGSHSMPMDCFFLSPQYSNYNSHKQYPPQSEMTYLPETPNPYKDIHRSPNSFISINHQSPIQPIFSTPVSSNLVHQFDCGLPTRDNSCQKNKGESSQSGYKTARDTSNNKNEKGSRENSSVHCKKERSLTASSKITGVNLNKMKEYYDQTLWQSQKEEGQQERVIQQQQCSTERQNLNAISQMLLKEQAACNQHLLQIAKNNKYGISSLSGASAAANPNQKDRTGKTPEKTERKNMTFGTPPEEKEQQQQQYQNSHQEVKESNRGSTLSQNLNSQNSDYEDIQGNRSGQIQSLLKSIEFEGSTGNALVEQLKQVINAFPDLSMQSADVLNAIQRRDYPAALRELKAVIQQMQQGSNSTPLTSNKEFNENQITQTKSKQKSYKDLYKQSHTPNENFAPREKKTSTNIEDYYSQTSRVKSSAFENSSRQLTQNSNFGQSTQERHQSSGSILSNCINNVDKYKPKNTSSNTPTPNKNSNNNNGVAAASAKGHARNKTATNFTTSKKMNTLKEIIQS